MKAANLIKTKKRLMLLGLGCMRFLKVTPDKEIDIPRACEIIDYA